MPLVLVLGDAAAKVRAESPPDGPTAMMIHPLHLISAAFLVASAAAQSIPAQDLIAVEFDGTVIAVDSRTGRGEPIGPSGRTGHNCMARHGTQLYTTEQVGTGTLAQFHLNTIDDLTGQATRSLPITRDLRGLESGGGLNLIAVAENGTSDQLVRVNTLTGTITVIGSLGFNGVQGLALHGNVFYAWDTTAGLLRVDHLTGVATDVNPSFGTGGADIQFLSSVDRGRLFGGRRGLYAIDVATGVPNFIGGGTYNDLRGLEDRHGVHYRFGQGCNGVALSMAGAATPNTTIDVAIIGQRRNAAGSLFLGFSDSAFQNFPLPASLDNFLGTSGCFLYAGSEIVFPTSANTFGVSTVAIPVPRFTEGLVFHVQHVSASNGAGGLAFTNGGSVRLSL